MAVERNWYLNVCFLKSPKVNNLISVIQSISVPFAIAYIFWYCFSSKFSKYKAVCTFFAFYVKTIKLFNCVGVDKLARNLELDWS